MYYNKEENKKTMKLSKKNAARQRAIQKTIASGKALGGLLVGLTAATVVGGCSEASPSRTMGVILDHTGQQVNATSEDTEVFVTGGVIAEPEPQPPQPKPNAVRERRDKELVPSGKPLPPPAPPLPAGQYRVKDGDALTKIAKTHGTTVAELKRLNGFDDVRADKLVIGEVIKVPSQKPNAVNEDRSKTLSVKGVLPLQRSSRQKK